MPGGYPREIPAYCRTTRGIRPQQVGMPHIRSLEGQLWEIRLIGRDGIARAIYVARSRQRLTVLHVFAKKTQKTPHKAMKTSQERLRSLDDE